MLAVPVVHQFAERPGSGNYASIIDKLQCAIWIDDLSRADIKAGQMHGQSG